MKPAGKHDRTLFRMSFPVVERPVIRFAGCEYVVTELSEGGARIIVGDETPLAAHESFVGTIHFKDEQTDSIKGNVLRIDKAEVVLRFSVGVSLKRMMDLQIELRKRYPIFYELPDRNPKTDRTPNP